jgi:hypothetical protein
MSLPEGGRAVSGFVDALKSQPLSLALVVMNIGLLGFLYYDGIVAHDERKTEMELLYKNRTEMAELLYRCTPTTTEKR